MLCLGVYVYVCSWMCRFTQYVGIFEKMFGYKARFVCVYYRDGGHSPFSVVLFCVTSGQCGSVRFFECINELVFVI